MSQSNEKVNKHACPCCYNIVLPYRGQYDICDICHWEDEPQFPNDDHEGYEYGPNHMTLAKWRKRFLSGWDMMTMTPLGGTRRPRRKR